MKNKEQKIVRLLEEGFSYETIKKMSNLHINKIYESLDEVETYSSTTQIFDLDNESDREEFDKEVNSDEPKQVSSTKDGKAAITSENEEVEEEMTEDDVDNIHPFKGQQTQDPKQDGPSTDDGDDNYQDGMDLFEDIDEDAVIEELFGNSKKKMKTPITTLGMFEEINEGTRCWKGYKKKGMKTMFGKRVPNCVKKESKEEKVRQIEESILSLIKKSQGKVITKKELLSEEPSIAPVKPKVKPGVRPERGTPYKPKHSPKPKAGTEVKPARPTVKPGVRPERGTPYKPKHSPKPKAGGEQDLPEFLKFNNLNIKFRDE